MIEEHQDEWVHGFLEYKIEVEKKAKGTIVDMQSTLLRAIETLKTIAPGKALWLCSLEDFMQYVTYEREQGKSSSSIAKQLSHIRGMLDYAWRSGRANCNVLDGFNIVDNKAPSEAPPVLSIDEARDLLMSCDRRTSLQRRDRLIIIMLYGCGLRSNELCDLNINDLDIERQEIVVRGKGDKERILPIPNVVWTEVLAYLSDRKWKRGPLFRTDKKRVRISSHYLRRVVRYQAIKAGITMKLTPKILRHTFASHMIERGVKVEYISSLMGHRSVNETGVYLHALVGRKDEAIQKLSLLEEI